MLLTVSCELTVVEYTCVCDRDCECDGCVTNVTLVLQAELRGVLLKRRADDSDDDPGLPHSPASPSTPPAASRHRTELKVGPPDTGQSSR